MGATEGNRHSQGFHFESSLYQPSGGMDPKKIRPGDHREVGWLQEPNPQNQTQRRESRQLLFAFSRKLKGDIFNQ